MEEAIRLMNEQLKQDPVTLPYSRSQVTVGGGRFTLLCNEGLLTITYSGEQNLEEIYLLLFDGWKRCVASGQYKQGKALLPVPKRKDGYTLQVKEAISSLDSEQIQGESTFHTSNLLTLINSSGVVLVDSPDRLSLCIRMEPLDALVHAEFVLAHRAELEALQQELEAAWKAVAGEVRAYMEEQEPGTFAEASEFGIRDVLEALVESKADCAAARWYSALFDEHGEHTTFEQHWGSFLRICEQMQEEGAETDLYDDRAVPREFDQIRYE